MALGDRRRWGNTIAVIVILSGIVILLVILILTAILILSVLAILPVMAILSVIKPAREARGPEGPAR